jgi:hypothetical protein
MHSSSPPLVPVFGQIFAEGNSRPVFSGTTEIPLPARESLFRRMLRKSHPEARKVCLTVLNAAEQSIPAWFLRAGGKFLFSETEPVLGHKTLPTLSPVASEEKRRTGHSKKKPVKKSAKQKRPARKTLKRRSR